MASEWRDTTLGAAVTFFAGGDSFLKLEYTTVGIPVLAKGDVKPFGRVVHGGDRFMPLSAVVERGYRITKPGDYLLTTRDLTQDADFLGLLAPIPAEKKFLVNQGANIVRFSPEFDGRYLVYWCNGPMYRAYIKGHYVGSTQIHLRKDDFLNAPLLAPALVEQKAIAAALGSLDDKIEMNRRMNATLDTMVQALFQSWFVDFDPVRAKLDGRVPVGLDTATTALFPDSFLESEVGYVPKGWAVGKVSELATLSRSAVNPSDFPMETFDHFSLPAFDNGRTPKVEFGSSIMSNKYSVTPNSVLLSKLNPHIPRIWLPDLHASRRSVCSTEFMVVCSTPRAAREYLFSLFTSAAFSSVYGTLVTGTTGSHQRIRPESVLDMKIVIPSLSVIRAFADIAKPMFDRINRNTEQSGTLAILRDTLLPKLLNGTLRIPQLATASNPIHMASRPSTQGYT